MGPSHTTVRRLRVSPRGSATAGFTLIELVVLMVVVATLSAMAVPALGRLDESRSGLAATRARTLLAYAQLHARATLVSAYIVIDPATDRIEAYTQASSGSAASGAFTAVAVTFGGQALQALIDPNTRKALILDLAEFGSEIRAATPTDTFLFDATGIPRTAKGNVLTSDVVIELSDGALVRITRDTGLVLVE